MTGPSAIGSEKGTPTSTTSAPASSMAASSSSERVRSGCPAVMYTTSARLPCRRSDSNRVASGEGSDEVVTDTNPIPVRLFRLDDRSMKRAVLATVGQIDDAARMRQVAHGVADHAEQRTGEHFR